MACLGQVGAAQEILKAWLGSLLSRPPRQRVLQGRSRPGIHAGRRPGASKSTGWERVVSNYSLADALGKDRLDEALPFHAPDLDPQLDAHAAEHPNPGRTETFRRSTCISIDTSLRILLALRGYDPDGSPGMSPVMDSTT